MENARAVESPDDVECRSSVASPYTSLGSGRTSYNSLGLDGGYLDSTRARYWIDHGRNISANYLSLKAKADEGHAKHDSRTKAVMDALQGLQTKIRRIESERSQAEINLKCLTNETKDYKELLNQKQGESSFRDMQSSKDLEAQLEHAHDRCQILEKQLQCMHQLMQNEPKVTTTHLSATSPATVSPSYSAKTKCYTHTPAQSSFEDVMSIHSPVIEKLNDLEREHHRLSATQSRTECKILMLEDKIKEEENHRKLLQNKMKENKVTMLEEKRREDDNRVGLLRDRKNTMENGCHSNEEVEIPKTKKNRRRKLSRKVKAESNTKLTHQTDKGHPSKCSPPHYLLYFANIPFVVGQSTERSHSLGANIQNVLSIMKSHNVLCCDESAKSCMTTAHSKCKPKKSSVGSCKHIKDLLVTLQDEFAHLGFEYRDIASQLRSKGVDANSIARLEKEKEKVKENMDKKEKQIHVIRDHLEKVGETQCVKKKRVGGKQRKLRVNGDENGRNLNAVQTGWNKSPECKSNSKLEMYKKVCKLQTTLRKDDLKWE